MSTKNDPGKLPRVQRNPGIRHYPLPPKSCREGTGGIKFNNLAQTRKSHERPIIILN